MILPLNDAGIGVAGGCWPRCFAFTGRRVRWFTTATTKLEWRPRIELGYSGLQSDAFPNWLATHGRRGRSRTLAGRVGAGSATVTLLSQTGSPSRYRPSHTPVNSRVRSLARIMGNGASEEIRTPVLSLEGSCTAIVLQTQTGARSSNRTTFNGSSNRRYDHIS